jgi:hypothetical protein
VSNYDQSVIAEAVAVDAGERLRGYEDIRFNNPGVAARAEVQTIAARIKNIRRLSMSGHVFPPQFGIAPTAIPKAADSLSW